MYTVYLEDVSVNMLGILNKSNSQVEYLPDGLSVSRSQVLPTKYFY